MTTNVVVFKWKKEGYRSQFTAEHVNTALRGLLRHSTVPFRFTCITDDPEGLDHKVRVIPLWEDPHPAYGGGNWPNCFRRLRMFDAKMKRMVGAHWIWMDLDMLVCGNVDHILSDNSDFRIWRPDGGRSLCNGSLVSHNSGTRTEIWTDFAPDKVGTVEEFQSQAKHLGSDQAWIAQRLRPEDQFFGSQQGVYAFRSLRNPHRERYLGAMGRVRKDLPMSPRKVEPFTGLRRDPVRSRFALPPGWRRRETSRPSRLQVRQDARAEERIMTALPPNACLVFFPGQWHPWDQQIQDVYPWVKEHYK